MRPSRPLAGIIVFSWALLVATSALAQPPAWVKEEARPAPGPGYIVAESIATADPKLAKDKDHAVLLALRTARALAYEHLLGMVVGVRLQTSVVLTKEGKKEEVLRTSVEATLRGARVLREDFEFTPQGAVIARVRVGMRLPPGGAEALASPATPAPARPRAAYPAYKEVPGAPTGLIIEVPAEWWGLPALSPRVVVQASRREIYAINMVDPETFLNEGVAEYAASLEGARGKTQRVGARPLLVRAVGVRGAQCTDPLVSEDDAERILKAEAAGKFLHWGRVVIVLPRQPRTARGEGCRAVRVEARAPSPAAPPAPPAAPPAPRPKVEAPKETPGPYTGLIVVRPEGWRFHPALVPRILSAGGAREVYSSPDADRETFLNSGLVSFAGSVEGARKYEGRVGKNPLVVDAVAMARSPAGFGCTDPVVNDADAERILKADAEGEFLFWAGVVFVSPPDKPGMPAQERCLPPGAVVRRPGPRPPGGRLEVKGYGLLDPSQPREEALRKAHLQALLNAYEGALVTTLGVEIKASSTHRDFIVRSSRVSLEAEYRVREGLSVVRRDLHLDEMLRRQLTAFRFRGPKGEGVRHIVNQEMPGRVSEREVRFVEGLLRQEGFVVAEKRWDFLYPPPSRGTYRLTLRWSQKPGGAGEPPEGKR